MAGRHIEVTLSESLLTSNIRRVHRSLLKRVRAKFFESDSSFDEWMALRLFAEGTIETAGDLAREFGIATGATTRLIDSLESQGFIERGKKDGDRRVVLLRMTQKGAAYFRAKLPDLHDCWADILVDWNRSDVEQLNALLAKLQDSLEQANST